MNARVKDTRIEITGTLDRTPGRALIQSFDVAADGHTIEIEWAGETEMFWDDQRTDEHPDGSPVYLGTDGENYHARQLELYDPCSLCRGECETPQYDQTQRANVMKPCPACGGDGADCRADGTFRVRPFPVQTPEAAR
jgi:hypothetical protein